MSSDMEPAKTLLPYLQRADELQKHEPLVAYYCRLYAMDRGLKIPQKERTKTTNALLVSLMKQLEKDKKSLKFAPDDNLYVEGFASKLFSKADKQDRDGRADLNTAKTFYAASIFFEILNQFGELQPDIEQKQKYAVWKAADIRKAIKEGRKPVPGPPGGEEDSPLTLENDTSDLGASENFSLNKQDGFSSSHFEEQKFQRNESLSTSYRPADLPSHHTDRVSPQDLDKFSPQDSRRNDRVSPHEFGHTDRVSPQDYGHTENSSPQDFGQAPRAPSSYSGPDYSTNDYHQQVPPASSQDYSTYPQHYDHQSYTHEQQSTPNNHYSESYNSSFSYPNFQSYPSFQESSFPAAPTHQPSYYHGPDAPSLSHQSAPTSNYSATMQYSSTGGSSNHTESNTVPEAYHYDSNYQPSVEKIAEALKSARFAVGSLAFDDVSTAVEHLRRSLELLTQPSSKIH